MRETQFIGLTISAEKFVEGLERLFSDREVEGMFEEKIPLKRWKMHPIFSRDDRPSACIREIEQCCPWSSGPMIFTCLEIDWGNGAQSLCYQWVEDPMLSKEALQAEEDRKWIEEGNEGPCRITILVGDEYDRDKGTMWV